jgi:hypothetical protein
MSISELLLDVAKPWLDLRAENLQLDDSLSVNTINSVSGSPVSFPDGSSSVGPVEASILKASAVTNQVELACNSAFKTTISAVVPAANRIVTIPDAGASSSIILSEGAQTKNGVLTLGSAPILSSLTASAPVFLNGSKAITNSGIMPVSNGGTNSSALLLNGRIIYTNAGKMEEFTAMSNGQLIIGSTSAAPVAGSITAGTNIVVTPGAGSLSIGLTGSVAVVNGGTNSITALNNDQMMISSAGSIIEGGALTNGQLFIGSTSAAPVKASLTGTANRITVTGGAGSITLSGPQDIATTSNVQFDGIISGIAGTGLTLNNSAITLYSPSVLNCWEELTVFTSGFTGAWAFDIDFTLSRRGKQVTLSWEDANHAAAANTNLTGSVAVPSRFIPLVNKSGVFLGQDNSATVNITGRVSNIGIIDFFLAPLVSFTNAGNCGIYSGSLVYDII